MSKRLSGLFWHRRTRTTSEFSGIESPNGSYQISVYDSGPKLLALGTASSNATKTFDIRVSLTFTSNKARR